MSDYSPPSEDLPIFDSSIFLSDDQPLTYNQAKKKFLKYPNAQGTENLLDINVSGVSNFLNNVNFGSITSTNNTPIINTNLSKFNFGYGGSGSISVSCPLNIGGSGSLSLTSANMNISGNGTINQAVSSSYNIFSSSFIKSNYGTTTLPTLSISDLNSNSQIVFYPKLQSGYINPATTNGCQSISSFNSTINTESLELTTYSTVSSIIRITPNNLLLGYGGNTSTPSSYINFDGSNVIISPSLKFSDNRIQNSSFTGAGNLAGSYTNTNLTIDSNGKITALSNGISSVNKTYTQQFIGYFPSAPFGGLVINPPPNCIKYDVILIGSGGLAGPLTASNSTTLNIGGAGGGGQVCKMSNIPIPPLWVNTPVSFYLTTKSTISTGGMGTTLSIGGYTIAEAKDGNDGTSTLGGAATSSNGYLNTNLGYWVVNQGSAGQNGYTSSFFTQGLPVGGGNLWGGIIGNPQYTTSTTVYQYGQGQRNNSLTGTTYGYSPISASPIQYGGVIFTWYLE